MQQTMQALQNELDSLRADNIKLYEKIKFLQSYPGRVRACVCVCVSAWMTVLFMGDILVFDTMWILWYSYPENIKKKKKKIIFVCFFFPML